MACLTPRLLCKKPHVVSRTVSSGSDVDFNRMNVATNARRTLAGKKAVNTRAKRLTRRASWGMI